MRRAGGAQALGTARDPRHRTRAARSAACFPPDRSFRPGREGELGEDKSFYFRGPKNALKLRAQNLILFLQLADGVDEGAWLHHLRAGDYSRWFEDAIKDAELAEEARAVEANKQLSASESRKRIAEMVTRRYTAPAKSSH